jgi:mono/diheme cytochrome c family protein
LVLLSIPSGQAPATPPPVQSRPPLVIKSLEGRDLYEFYCGSCHGKTGHGDGQSAKSLKTAPPDLTTLASRNGGVFPRERVQAVLIGVRPTPSHGTTEMPVWGDVFRFLDPSDQRAKMRIANLTEFLASLQAKR